MPHDISFSSQVCFLNGRLMDWIDLTVAMRFRSDEVQTNLTIHAVAGKAVSTVRHAVDRTGICLAIDDYPDRPALP